MNLVKPLIVGFFALMAGTAAAAPVLCLDTAKNHMAIDSATVSSCLAAGAGNPSLTGNPDNDTFLTSAAGAGFTLASKSDGSDPYEIEYTRASNTNPVATGTFGFDPSFWLDYSAGAIGFKFGTGNNPDDWFVFQLAPNIDDGSWQLIKNAGKQGGGLSHVNLYGVRREAVAEPATVGLFTAGLIALYFSRRKQRS